MEELQLSARATQDTPQIANEAALGDLQMTRDGMLFVANSYRRALLAGRVFGANSGEGSGVAAFTGAFDADGPDFHLNVPVGTTIIPIMIEVIFEIVGTEATMEIIALASDTGDISCTVTGGEVETCVNMLIGGPASNCVCNGSVDAAGCTDPYSGNYLEFWKEMRPLTDTVATGENDRIALVYRWVAEINGPAPAIRGRGAEGSALVIYACSNAGSGYITAIWEELSPDSSYIH